MDEYVQINSRFVCDVLTSTVFILLPPSDENRVNTITYTEAQVNLATSQVFRYRIVFVKLASTHYT